MWKQSITLLPSLVIRWLGLIKNLEFTALALSEQQGFERGGGWNEDFSQIEASLEDVNLRIRTAVVGQMQ
ncbi:hypothetical protein HMPREF0293_0675 [Corynebacterium glucuronolyticum ATCC 51866]|uniref:Uncharacterized protein n=1 Tax=Corynebacterium glucuronolyticum ATCC 51866 TaxID=548478 RepID=A0ABM9XRR9_9CORY|nr:hypothetical protein HMPREF0293_0675 [Corynebacterium glucuronolyticum ATCC 51866]